MREVRLDNDDDVVVYDMQHARTGTSGSRPRDFGASVDARLRAWSLEYGERHARARVFGQAREKRDSRNRESAQLSGETET